MKQQTNTETPSTNVVALPLQPKKKKMRAEDKWSPKVMKLGYTPLPNLLLRAQAKLIQYHGAASHALVGCGRRRSRPASAKARDRSSGF